MAITKTFGFTTDTSSSIGLNPIMMKPATEFALVEDEPDCCSLINNESKVDLGEKLSYTCRQIQTVASGLDNMHPSSVTTGVQYQVKLDEQLSLTDTSNPTYREDLPITLYLTVRHPKNGNIDGDDIMNLMKRLLGACMKTTGTSQIVTQRFDDLMKSALRPTQDLAK